MQTLTLEKYVEEAVGAVMEGVAKCKTGAEVQGAVEVRAGLLKASVRRWLTFVVLKIISAIHQRFPLLFTPPFVGLLLASLKPGSASSSTDKDIKEKEDAARIVRQRGLLRILGELEVVGLVEPAAKKGKEKSEAQTGEVTWGVLKELVRCYSPSLRINRVGPRGTNSRRTEQLTADKDSLSLASPLAIAFTKHLGHLYLPDISPSSSTDSELAPPATSDFPSLSSSSSPFTDLVPLAVADKFLRLLQAYLTALGRSCTARHLELQKQDRRNHEAYIRSGEVFEDREKGYEKSVKAWERGWTGVVQ